LHLGLLSCVTRPGDSNIGSTIGIFNKFWTSGNPGAVTALLLMA